MGVIRRTRTSIKDYGDIWDYIAEHGSPDAADGVLREFDRQLTFLSDNPFAGPSRAELRPRLRSFPVGNYLLFYRPLRGGVKLSRVVHGARDLRRIFRK